MRTLLLLVITFAVLLTTACGSSTATTTKTVVVNHTTSNHVPQCHQAILLLLRVNDLDIHAGLSYKKLLPLAYKAGRNGESRVGILTTYNRATALVYRASLLFNRAIPLAATCQAKR